MHTIKMYAVTYQGPAWFFKGWSEFYPDGKASTLNCTSSSTCYYKAWLDDTENQHL